jgi:hypothetical protein
LARLLELLVELLPRWLAIWLRLRRVSPEGHYWPVRSVRVEPIDTGGGFRAAWRMQDPSQDPKEPYGSESSSTGQDHGWSNCTMTSGALAIAYQQPRGALAPWGGDMRHRQGDLSGGTDLYDLRTAWSAYGETLTIKSGAGWSAVVSAHDAERAIVIQGSGNVPGSESFDGGHACVIAPETHSSGDWLFGDPLASGWQWVSPSSIRSWAEHWQSSVAFAVGEAPPPPEPPTPKPPEPPEPEPCPEPVDLEPIIRAAELAAVESERDRSVGEWVDWLGAGEAMPGDEWSSGWWSGDRPVTLDELLEAERCDESARWARGPVPDPVASAHAARTNPARWEELAWRALLWP